MSAAKNLAAVALFPTRHTGIISCNSLIALPLTAETPRRTQELRSRSVSPPRHQSHHPSPSVESDSRRQAPGSSQSSARFGSQSPLPDRQSDFKADVNSAGDVFAQGGCPGTGLIEDNEALQRQVENDAERAHRYIAL